MKLSKQTLLSGAILILTLLSSVMLGVVLGLTGAATKNTDQQGGVGETVLSLPTQVYDLKGELVTEFFGTERRELLDYNEVPRITIQSLMSREDRDFFEHNGFSLKGTARALFKILSGQFVSGGSTLTQQLAGHLYADRSEKSVGRKLKELWWSWQLERHLSKQEILELYFNKMPFGHNTYGIQAASRFFFGHPISQADAAESVLIMIQLASPSGRYSPIKNPRRARIIQKEVMGQMVGHGFITQAAADKEFEDYWANYDWSRDAAGTAFLDREDKAPYFSEYIRNQLNTLLSGNRNIYTDGYQVYTTLNVDFQKAADEEVNRGLQIASERLRENQDARYGFVNEAYLPMIDLLALNFGLDELRIEGGQTRRFAREYYDKEVNSTIDMATLMFGFNTANRYVQNAAARLAKTDTAGRIQSALVTIEQSTGYILSIIGGRRFDRLDQLNRAVTAKIMPGSSYKPLYYAEAIASGRLTAASNLDNYAKAWFNEDGSLYTPTNYDGSYSNNGVLLRRALALSLNIPAVSVLETIGFDAAIARSSRLMGITDPREISLTFPRTLALSLGTIGVTPLQMARAFAVFPNGGRDVEPIAIRYVKDRYGQIVLDVENDVRRLSYLRSEESQILSPQAATIMVDLLRDAVRYGTLYWAHTRTANEEPRINMPFGGKTGTSQNWSDAWGIGFSPYYTTAVWLGFDKGGQTLGQNNEASSSSAYIFMRYMKRIHEGLPFRDFTKASGLISVAVCADSGELPTPSCPRVINEFFLPGTVPNKYCELHGGYLGDKTNSDVIYSNLDGENRGQSYTNSSSTNPYGIDPTGGMDFSIDRPEFSSSSSLNPVAGDNSIITNDNIRSSGSETETDNSSESAEATENESSSDSSINSSYDDVTLAPLQ